MTDRDFLALLRCPSCGSSLTYHPVDQCDSEAGSCGLLRCPCYTYPVLDSVPVLIQERLTHRSIADDRVIASGPTPEALTKLVESGQALDGLVDLLTFPVCPWPLNRVGALRRLSLRGPHHALGLAYRKRRIRSLLARRHTLTAEDWFDAFYWHAPVPFDPFNYFFFRFGQPRHLATLSLLSILPPDPKPLLDIACGYGHFLHSVTTTGQAGIGLDQNFHQIWVARHYVAPSASFVCADAIHALPFQDNVCAAALCADAFQHLYDKVTTLAELDRCVDNGPILLASIENQFVGPLEGEELTPDGYAALLQRWQWRVLTQDAILGRYLNRQGPDLQASATPDDANQSEWLYYVIAHDDALFRDHGALDAWPHAAGDLQVNPIYEVEGDRLTFRFPSPWFAIENGEMLDYMSRTASLKEDPERLVAQAVLVGVPARYARERGRPWTVAANSWLLHLARRLHPS